MLRFKRGRVDGRNHRWIHSKFVAFVRVSGWGLCSMCCHKPVFWRALIRSRGFAFRAALAHIPKTSICVCHWTLVNGFCLPGEAKQQCVWGAGCEMGRCWRLGRSEGCDPWDGAAVDWEARVIRCGTQKIRRPAVWASGLRKDSPGQGYRFALVIFIFSAISSAVLYENLHGIFLTLCDFSGCEWVSADISERQGPWTAQHVRRPEWRKRSQRSFFLIHLQLRIKLESTRIYSKNTRTARESTLFHPICWCSGFCGWLLY